MNNDAIVQEKRCGEMYKATRAIKEAFDSKKLKYHIMDNGEVSAVEAGISGENYFGMEVVFFSPDNDNDVAVRIMKMMEEIYPTLMKALYA